MCPYWNKTLKSDTHARQCQCQVVVEVRRRTRTHTISLALLYEKEMKKKGKLHSVQNEWPLKFCIQWINTRVCLRFELDWFGSGKEM